MHGNPSTALVKSAQSPALARVSNQLALADKLLTKPDEPFLIPYRKGNKWGFCDRNKNIMIDCVYDDVVSFRDGFAGARRGYKYEFIDGTGNTILDFTIRDLNYEYVNGWLEDTNWISENVIVVQRTIDEFRYRIINLHTREIIKFGNDKPYIDSECSNGLLVYHTYPKHGFINPEGKVIIPQIYSMANGFAQGLAPVRAADNSWLIINTKNEIVSEVHYGWVDSSSEGLFKVSIPNSTYSDKFKRKYGYINKDGELMIDIMYDEASDFSSGLAAVKIEPFNYGYINKSSREIIQPAFEVAGDFIRGLAVVRKNGKFGVINKQGETVIPFKYSLSGFSAFRGGVARVAIEEHKKDKEFYIDRQGNEYYEK